MREQLEGVGQEISVVGVGGEGRGAVHFVNGSTDTMPGFVPQSESTLKLSESSKGANGDGAAPRPTDEVNNIKMEDTRNGGSHVEGDRALVNGSYANGVSATPSKPQPQMPTTSDEMSRQLPPEIQHISSGYVSLSALIARLTQETFNDLTNVINDMADVPVQQSAPNGVPNHSHHPVNGSVPAKSEANVQKKLRMLNFTNNWRPRFIKALVLSGWARQAEAISRVIDLKNWQDNQRLEYGGAATAMGELKRMLVPMKEPSPDIKTALEVLLLGKASWLPDFEYLSAETLSIRQMLDALRRINTLLSIRLNLHESIPPLFRDFSIASGRATFRIRDEFEVDLSIANEDIASQLYFIDFRFAFTPSVAGLPPGGLRAELEARANHVLSREGLQGLFDLLHNFVLTHKLSILRSQAYDMSRGYWSEHLKVEPVRRSVVMQYWSNKPGAKNWIEIGLRRGEERRVAYTETSQRIPSIGIRWFRAGNEVQDFEVDLKLGDLSMEHILKQVVAQHSSYIFEGIGEKLSEGLLYTSGLLKLQHKASKVEPTDASLLVQLTASTAIKILQEPVSGRFAVQPSSQLYSRAERELNRLSSPVTEAPSQISYLRSLASVEGVDINAQAMGWEPARSINPGKEAMQQYFPKGTKQTRFFRKRAWSSRWILAFTTSLEGDFWWVVELSDGKTTPKSAPPQASVGGLLKAAYKVVSQEKPSLVFEPSRSALNRIERCAAGMIAQHSDTRALLASGIEHKVRLSTTGSPMFSMYLRFSCEESQNEKTPSFLRSRKHPAIPWANEIVKLDYRGLDATTREAVRVASARLNKPVAKLKEITSSISNLAINRTSGAFAFQLVHQVGESSIPDLTRHLTAIERLLDFISTLNGQTLAIDSASLSHVEFTYAIRLKATVHFPANAPVYLSLPDRNPHLRILDYLTSSLLRQGLVPLIAMLRMTLPLLSALTAIEKVHKTNGVKILARSESWYEVRYSSPIIAGGFDIRLDLRRDYPWWHIKEPTIKKTETLPDEEAWRQALKTVTRGKGKGWRGMHGGVAASIDEGIGEALQKLDEVFRNARHVAEASRPGKRKAADQIVEID